MALRSAFNKGNVGPSVFKSFAATTAAVLHKDASQGGAAPGNINHLPCGVLIVPGAAASFIFKDVYGLTITMALATNVEPKYLPIEIAELDATNARAVVVCWRPTGDKL